ncbi:MAG: hypothetical protein JNL82_31740 [Myxococcales bacterium]|nr:hypothetical protein [Myxococcales bacterium]
MLRPRAALTTLLAPLAVLALLACAGADDDQPNGSSFGSGGSAAPTMPTMPGTSMTAPTTGLTDGGSDDGDVDEGPSPTSNASNDPSGPPPSMCGNGVLEDDEACDGDDLGGKDCTSFGFDMGTLSCAADCSYDTSFCSVPGCGDGVLMGGEECDCGEQAGACTPAGLNMYECTDLMSPKGTPYSGGVLTCNSPDACNFNKTGCTYCGDNMINGAEQCDGANVNGATCVSQGFKAGNLFCEANACTFNTSGCTNVVCGDGECAAPMEDDCTCPEDCPDQDPNMCSACECGATSTACGCDILCLAFNDCCANGPC